MEFHEKLQELRKNRGLTQEELAEALYVSRTAISKWESGRGYPSIDSLKEISKYFSVTIDDLLSSEKMLTIAEQENKANLRSMCDLLFGLLDVGSFVLIFLPLYPNTINGFVYSVNLFSYTQITSLNRILYWSIFISLIIVGVLKLLLTKVEMERYNRIVAGISMSLSVLAILLLAMARESYAVVVSVLLLLIKGCLLFKYAKLGG